MLWLSLKFLPLLILLGWFAFSSEVLQEETHVKKNIARIEFEVQANSEVQIAFIFGSIGLEIVTVGLNVRVQDGTEKANDVTT